MGDPGINTLADRLATATRCAELGLRTIVGRTDKFNKFVPALKYAKGLRTDDTAVAARMVREHRDSERIAFICGPCKAGYVVGIDLDVNHGDGANGKAEFRMILDQLGIDKLPPHPEWTTPRGGRQLLFLVPGDGVPMQAKPAPGIEIKQKNGLMTCPPTVRAHGAYRWLAGAAPWETNISTLPAPLLRLWRARPAPINCPPPSAYRPPATDAEPKRRKRYIDRAVQSEASKLALCAVGGRNAALNVAARHLGNLHAGEPDLLTEAAARAALLAACIANGYIGEKGETAFAATFDSGFRFGLNFARAVPAPQTQRPPITRRAP